jgi:cell fate (sporulation/competence/biofilm development) regulator YlbF (YheA/YmcA/DUF963 family)
MDQMTKGRASKGKDTGPSFLQIQVTLDEVRQYSALLVAEYPDLEGDEKAFSDTLEGLTDGREVAEVLLNRAVDIKRRVARIDADSEALKQIVADNTARADRFEAQENSLKAAALELMEAMTLPGKRVYLESDRFTAWRTTQSDAQRKLLEVDPSKTPAAFMRTLPPPPPVPDKEAIRAILLNPPPVQSDEEAPEITEEFREARKIYDAVREAFVLASRRNGLTIRTR